MKYYQLMFDYENDTDTVLGICNEVMEFNQYDLVTGIPMEFWNEKFTFHYDPNEGERFTDYLGNDLGWFLISDKFKSIIEMLQPEGLQYLPIVINNSLNNFSNTEYYVANVVNLVEALDLDNSVYDEWDVDGTQKLLAFEMHAIKKDKVVGMHIFKLADDPLPIFVSEVFKRSIEESNISGCDFLEVIVVQG